VRLNFALKLGLKKLIQKTKLLKIFYDKFSFKKIKNEDKKFLKKV